MTAWVSAFTVIEMDDWSLLFIGERLTRKDEFTDLYDIQALAGNTPFTLSIVEAFGSRLEAQISHGAELDDIKLHEALKLAKEWTYA